MLEELFGFTHIYIDNHSPKTLLLLHGTGGNERDLVPLAQTIDPDANTLSPRGNVLENGQPRFFKRLAEGVFDRKDLAARSLELSHFIQKTSEKYNFPLAGLVALGYSNGANIALHLLAQEPTLLKKAILLRPMAAALPSEIKDLQQTKVFLGVGELDPLVPPDNTQHIVDALQSHGALVTVSQVPAAHGLTPADIMQAQSWYRGL